MRETDARLATAVAGTCRFGHSGSRREASIWPRGPNLTRGFEVTWQSTFSDSCSNLASLSVASVCLSCIPSDTRGAYPASLVLV